MNDYTKGCLDIMDNHLPEQPLRRGYGLTKAERAFLDGCGAIIPPIPRRIVRKTAGNPPTPEAQAAFAAWVALPEAERFHGIISHLAKKHGAIIHQVHNLCTRHKNKEKTP